MPGDTCTVIEPLYEGFPLWKTLVTTCAGCGFQYGSFNVDAPSKCPKCAVYGTRHPPEEGPTA